MQAAQLLYKKHPDITKTVQWSDSEEKFKLVDMSGLLPKLSEDEIHEEEIDETTKIQVIGHGRPSEKDSTISGMTGAETANRLLELIPERTHVGRINLIACNLGAVIADTGEIEERAVGFLQEFLSVLRQGEVHTTVSVRSTLVGVSSTGRKLIGYDRGHGDILWTSKGQYGEVYKVEASLDDQGKIQYASKRDSSEFTSGLMEMKGINEIKDHVFISLVSKNSVLENTWFVDTVSLDELLDDTSRNLYELSNPDETPETKRIVVKEGSAPNSYIIRSIRMITQSPQTFIDELKRQAERYKANSRNKAEREVNDLFYRFGDWVYKLDPDTFYVDLVGLVIAEDVPDELKETNGLLTQNEVETLPQSRNREFLIPGIGKKYREMRTKFVSNSFLDVSRLWLTGRNADIRLPEDVDQRTEQAAQGKATLAMFLSESIRSFRNHVTNTLGMDLYSHKLLTWDQFWERHPMARGGTWQETVEETDISKRKKVGMEPSGDFIVKKGYRKGKWVEEAKYEDSPKARMRDIFGTWISNLQTWKEDRLLLGSLENPKATAIETVPQEIAHPIRNLVSSRMSSADSTNVIRDYPLALSHDLVSEQESEVVNNDQQYFSDYDDGIRPAILASTLARDVAYVNSKVRETAGRMKPSRNRNVEVDEGSIKLVSDGCVSFEVVWDKNVHPGHGRKRLTVQVGANELASPSVIQEIRNGISTITKSKAFRAVNKAVAALGILTGLDRSIAELEHGDVADGMMDLAQSIHGLGGLSGLNYKVSSVGKKLVGTALRPLVNGLTASKPELRSMVKAAGRNLGNLVEALPLVGTAFDIYNIMQDLKSHTVHGDIDAAFDIILTILSFFGPETEIITGPLMMVRLVFDEVHGRVFQFFKHLGVKILGLFETFSPIGWIVGAFEDTQKLNSEYKKEQAFLSQLADYTNYYRIFNSSTIDFTGGIASLYAGSLVFRLGDDGITANVSYVSSMIDGKSQYESQPVDFGGSVIHDVVLGYGETTKLTTEIHKVKLFFVITVDSKRIIKSRTEDQSSLHGTYYGNDMNNTFYAVQHLPLDYPFDIAQYSYELYGLAGNDSFVLGPQRVFVHGGLGTDTYFISRSGSNVTIDNYATDSLQDHIILDAEFESTEHTMEAADVVISVVNEVTTCGAEVDRGVQNDVHDCKVHFNVSHRIILENWFQGSNYRHIDVHTADGYFYNITSGKDGYPIPAVLAIDLKSRKGEQFMDLQQDFPNCTAIHGSNYADVLIGNDLDNYIIGGLGNDNITGGRGVDMFIIREGDGVDILYLNNYAEDRETDSLFIDVPHEQLEIDFDREGLDLILYSRSSNNTRTGVVIKGYYRGDDYQHLIVVTRDGLVADLPTELGAKNLTFTYVEHDAKLVNLTREDLLGVHTVSLTNRKASAVGNYLNNVFIAPNGSLFLHGTYGSNVYFVSQNSTVHTTDGLKELVVSNLGRFRVNCRFNGHRKTSGGTVKLSASTLPCHEIDPNHSNLVFQTDTNASEVVVVPPKDLGRFSFDNLLLKSDGILYNFSYDSTLNLRPTPIDLNLTSGKINWPLSGTKFDIIMARTKSVRLFGPPNFTRIKGTKRSEYLDPGPGGCFINAGGGSDTFVFKSHYGTNNTIKRSVHDKAIDTVSFMAPYEGIAIKLDKGTSHLVIYSESVKLAVQFEIIDEAPLNLLVVSSDGVTAEIQGNKTTGYSLAPKILNRASGHGEMINLTMSSVWDTVRTVQGSSKFPNHLFGNDIDNSLRGGECADTIYGGGGNDVLTGGGGDDTLFGEGGDDILLGGTGGDLLSGGDGDDLMFTATLLNDGEQDEIDGGYGTDTVAFAETPGIGCKVSLLAGAVFSSEKPGEIAAFLANVENVIGTHSNDTIVGDNNDNRLLGRDGADTLVPMDGSDLLVGGEGNDTYRLLAGTNVIATINNYAEDLAEDVIDILQFNGSGQMCLLEKWLNYTILQRFGEHLAIRWLDLNSPKFYNNDQSPRIILYKWFDGDKYRHVCLHICSRYYCEELNQLSTGLAHNDIVTIGGAGRVPQEKTPPDFSSEL